MQFAFFDPVANQLLPPTKHMMFKFASFLLAVIAALTVAISSPLVHAQRLEPPPLFSDALIKLAETNPVVARAFLEHAKIVSGSVSVVDSVLLTRKLAATNLKSPNLESAGLQSMISVPTLGKICFKVHGQDWCVITGM